MSKYSIRNYPFIYLSIPLSAGIIAGYVYRMSPAAGLVSGSCMLLSGALFAGLHLHKTSKIYRYQWLAGFAASSFLFFAGMQLIGTRMEINRQSHYSHDPAATHLVVEIVDLTSKKGTLRCTAQVKETGSDAGFKPATGHLLLIFEKNAGETIRPGSRLLIRNRCKEIDPPKNPGVFDYKNYMQRKQVYHQVFLYENDWRLLGQEHSMLLAIQALRERMCLILKQHLPQAELHGVASALLFGARTDLSPDIVQAYSDTGTLHILSVSGLHVGILFLVIHFLTGPLERYRNGKIIRTLLILLFIWLYAIIAGLAPSILRASVMISFFVIGPAFNKRANAYNTLAASAFLILVFDPFALFDIGFQLSYLAVGGILLLQPPLYTSMYVKTYAGDKIWALISVSLAAQLASFPLIFYYFHQFPTYFLFANLAAIPLAALVLYAGILLLICGSLHILTGIITPITAFLVHLLNQSLVFVQSWPGSVVQHVHINMIQLLCLYTGIVLSCFFFIRKQKNLLFGILATAILFVSAELYQQWSRPGSVFIVYHSNGTMAAFINEGTATIYSAQAFDSTTFNYVVKPSLELYGIRKVSYLTKEIDITPLFTQKGSVIRFGTKRALFIDQNFNYEEHTTKLPVDYVICSDAFSDMDYLLRNFTVQLFILSGKPDKKKKALKIKCIDAGIRYYETIEKGAFISYAWM